MSPVAGVKGNIETLDASVKTSPEQDLLRVKYFPETVAFCLPRDILCLVTENVLLPSLSRQADSHLPLPVLCRLRHTKDCVPERKCPCPLGVTASHPHISGLSLELFASVVVVTKLLSSEFFCVCGLCGEGRVRRTEALLES